MMEIYINQKELSEYTDYERNNLIAYLGHQPELMSDTIENNICYGEKKKIKPYLEAVCMDNEVLAMSEGIKTVVGAGGIRLSGGQQARLALARTLYHDRKILVLDDPFSAVDYMTEHQIMKNLKEMFSNALIIILSHRITMFSEFDHVIWMENGRVNVGTHESILKEEEGYAKIYKVQQTGGALDEE